MLPFICGLTACMHAASLLKAQVLGAEFQLQAEPGLSFSRLRQAVTTTTYSDTGNVELFRPVTNQFGIFWMVKPVRGGGITVNEQWCFPFIHEGFRQHIRPQWLHMADCDVRAGA